MNNTFFSFKRFWLLLRNDIIINYKIYLAIIATTSIGIFFLIFSTMPDAVVINDSPVYGASRYQTLFITCLLVLGVFISTSFPALDGKTKTAHYLLLPSSILEKFLSQFLIRVVFASILLISIFWIDAQLARFIALTNMKVLNEGVMSIDKSVYIEKFQFSSLFVKTTFNGENNYVGLFEKMGKTLLIFSIASFLFAVRTFFTKFGTMLTITALILFFMSALLLVIIFSNIFYTENRVITDFVITRYLTVYENLSNVEVWLYSISMIIWTFLLPLGYYKLKEKQL